MSLKYNKSQEVSDSIEYIDSIIKEYLLFRGFKATLSVFDQDCKSDINRAFKPDSIVHDLFANVEALRINQALEYWDYLEAHFFSKGGKRSKRAIAMYKKRLQRYFIVCAINQNQRKKISSFFAIHGKNLAQDADWIPWLAINFVDDPQNRSEFSAVFTDDWEKALKISLSEFIHSCFQNLDPPKILDFEKDRKQIKDLELRIKTLNHQIAELSATSVISTSYIPQQDLISEDNNCPKCGFAVNKSTNSKADLANKDENNTSALDCKCTSKERSLSLASQHTKVKINSNQFTNPKEDINLKLIKQSLFLEHSSTVISAIFSPDGEKIASIDEDGFLKVWSHAHPDLVPITKPFDQMIKLMTWDSKAAYLLYLCFDDGKICTLNTNTRVLHDHFSVSQLPSNEIYFMEVHPLLEQIAIASGPSIHSNNKYVISIFDTKTNSALSNTKVSFNGTSKLVHVSYNHNGTLISASSSSGQVIIYESTTMKIVRCFTSQNIGNVATGSFSFDETHFFLLSDLGMLQQWLLGGVNQELVSESMLRPNQISQVQSPSSSGLQLGQDIESNSSNLPVVHLAKFSPSTEYLILGASSTALIYDTSLGCEVFRLKSHMENITCVDWDLTGSFVLYGSTDGTIRVGTILLE